VEAVLRYQPRRAERLYVEERGRDDLAALAGAAGVAVEVVPSTRLDALVGEGFAHQGVVLACGPFPFVELDDALAAAPTLVLVLDGVEDPRNFGAAVRAGYSLGADLVIVPGRRAAPASAAAHKTAAGTLSRIPVCEVENLKRALDAMKEKGIWVVGAEADGPDAPWNIDLTTPTALVIGGEDRGLRRLTRDACDHVVSIPMAAPDVSLNAADAATVLLYEVRRQRAIAAR